VCRCCRCWWLDQLRLETALPGRLIQIDPYPIGGRACVLNMGTCRRHVKLWASRKPDVAWSTGPRLLLYGHSNQRHVGWRIWITQLFVGALKRNNCQFSNGLEISCDGWKWKRYKCNNSDEKTLCRAILLGLSHDDRTIHGTNTAQRLQQFLAWFIRKRNERQLLSLRVKWVAPSLIQPHLHLIYSQLKSTHSAIYPLLSYRFAIDCTTAHFQRLQGLN
jgi:hypothetical protein